MPEPSLVSCMSTLHHVVLRSQPQDYVCKCNTMTWLILYLVCARYASAKHAYDRNGVSVQYSYMLAELFRNPVIIAHHRGHVVPGLDEERLEQLRSFLRARMHDSTL